MPYINADWLNYGHHACPSCTRSAEAIYNSHNDLFLHGSIQWLVRVVFPVEVDEGIVIIWIHLFAFWEIFVA